MSAATLDVLLPQLAMGMAEASIVEWLVAEGATVSRDQPLVSIETEKVVTELPAPSTGFVHLLARAGDKLPVETVIARIAPSQEAYRALLAPSAAAAGTHQRVIASGSARALAKEHGLDLHAVAGTGPGGRIVEDDVRRALAAARRPTLPQSAPRRLKARIPLTGVRRAIAERMVESSTRAAQTFVFFEVDVTDLLRVRAELLERLPGPGAKLSLLAFYAKAAALACRRVPLANATLEGEEICLWEEVNVGIAVALPGSTEFDSSLIVPVVHGADSLDIATLNDRIQQQVDKARAGALTPADLAGGTITISSTAGFTAGSWAVSTPLLNLPQVINFQPGTALKRPLVIEDQIAIRSVLPCGLTFDHRCLDGEPTGRFVRELSGYLSRPETMLP
ncbi:MAG TPA: dihydrolipoamide acetyltransferase family protein [Steroidobacteraceae bacterium]|nr:dihydrolipoamide acetyltransferase family protein [Steroidobacteraceae bacterium]